MNKIEYENLKKVNEPYFGLFMEEFESTLKSGWYILGEKVKKFEEEFAAYCGTEYCIGVASGLDALILSLKVFDFEEGSEVIVPSNTYIATILSIIHCHLKPVLVEPDICTYNIDPSRIEERITSKTVALIPVHLYGKLCNMTDIMDIANRNNLVVIEDCAQAHGASYAGKRAGSWGQLGAFSFYPTKNLGGLGDGGAITTRNVMFADKLRKLRNYGSGTKYKFDYAGINSRLDEIQAAFLSVKLKHLEAINEKKRSIADLYNHSLSEQFIIPSSEEGYHDVFHIFTIRHPERDKIKSYLKENGVETDIHYPISPVKQSSMIGIIDDQVTPISEEVHRTNLSLPISTFHDQEEIQNVIRLLNRFPDE